MGQYIDFAMTYSCEYQNEIQSALCSRHSTGATLARGEGGVQGVWTPALSRYSPNCALKFLNQFRRNALKNQLKKQNNPSKRCTNNILLKFFNPTFTSTGQKNVELIFQKLHLIRKLKFSIFNSMVIIFYLSFHMLSYFRVIHNI